MTVLLHDVEQSYLSARPALPTVVASGPPLFDLEYADDTCFFTRTFDETQLLLYALQACAAGCWGDSAYLRSISSMPDGQDRLV